MAKEARFIYQKRGVCYFIRRISSDLQKHYKRSRIAFSLYTKSHRAVATSAVKLASKLDISVYSGKVALVPNFWSVAHDV